MASDLFVRPKTESTACHSCRGLVVLDILDRQNTLRFCSTSLWEARSASIHAVLCESVDDVSDTVRSARLYRRSNFLATRLAEQQSLSYHGSYTYPPNMWSLSQERGRQRSMWWRRCTAKRPCHQHQDLLFTAECSRLWTTVLAYRTWADNGV